MTFKTMWNLIQRSKEINKMLMEDTSLTEEERAYYHQLLKTLNEQCVKESKKLSENPAIHLK